MSLLRRPSAAGAAAGGTADAHLVGEEHRGETLEFLREYGIFAALLLLVVVFAVATPDFRTFDNVVNIVNQVSVIGIIAIGMTFVILTAGIDLSVGSLLAVASLMGGTFAVKTGNAALLALLAFGLPVLVGLAGGLVNGALVAWAGVTPLIATLGTLTAYRGAAVQYRVNPIYGLHDWFRWPGTAEVASIPVAIFLFAGLALLASFVLNKTRFGRQVYAVGGNETAARAAGIAVARVKLAVYAISGVCVGVAAIIFTGRIGAGQAVAGQGFELQAVAAVVIGGASLFGGKGKISNTVVGALLIGVLFNGLVLLNVSSPIQSIIIGAIIVGAVAFDGFVQRRVR